MERKNVTLTNKKNAEIIKLYRNRQKYKAKMNTLMEFKELFKEFYPILAKECQEESTEQILDRMERFYSNVIEGFMETLNKEEEPTTGAKSKDFFNGQEVVVTRIPCNNKVVTE